MPLSRAWAAAAFQSTHFILHGRRVSMINTCASSWTREAP